jgi:hypothetical protein
LTSSPPLIAFLARNCLVGIAVGWLFLGGLILLDVGRIGELLFAAENWLLTLMLAAGGFAVTFGGLAMGTAIFLLPKRD